MLFLENLLYQCFNRATIIVVVAMTLVYYIAAYKEITDEEYHQVTFNYYPELSDEDKVRISPYFVDYISRQEYNEIKRLACLKK